MIRAKNRSSEVTVTARVCAYLSPVVPTCLSHRIQFLPQDPIKLPVVHFFFLLSFTSEPFPSTTLGWLVYLDTARGLGYLSRGNSGILDLPDCLLISNIFGKNARKGNSLQHVMMLFDGRAGACRFAYSDQHVSTPSVPEIQRSGCELDLPHGISHSS